MVILWKAKLGGNLPYCMSEICLHTVRFLYVVSGAAALELIINPFLILSCCSYINTYINLFYVIAFLKLYFLSIFKIMILGFVLPYFFFFFLNSCQCPRLVCYHFLQSILVYFPLPRVALFASFFPHVVKSKHRSRAQTQVCSLTFAFYYFLSYSVICNTYF